MQRGPRMTSKDLTGFGLGLTGAHRTGKTTLAKKFAEANDFKFLASSASTVAKILRVDINKMSFKERLDFQWTLLKMAEKQYEQEDTFFVTDRTPLDFCSYLLGDVRGDLEDKAVMEEIHKFVEEALRITSEKFLTVGLIQPGIPYEEQEGKPSFNTPRCDQLNYIIQGLLFDPRLKTDFFVCPKNILDLEERFKIMTNFNAAIFKENTEDMKGITIN